MKLWQLLVGILASLGLWGLAAKLVARRPRPAAVPRKPLVIVPEPEVLDVDAQLAVANAEIDAKSKADLVEIQARADKVADLPTAADRFNAAFGD